MHASVDESAVTGGAEPISSPLSHKTSNLTKVYGSAPRRTKLLDRLLAAGKANPNPILDSCISGILFLVWGNLKKESFSVASVLFDFG